MGELIRRLDYERRSKKSLSVDTGSGQRINKEYSTQVRAANEMEDRKKDLLIQAMEKHKKVFLDRHNYEKKVMIRFKDELDTKSEDFNEFRFQQLRAQSARGRLQGNYNNPDIGPVTEIIPRHYYRRQTSAAVKFDVSDADKSDDSSDSDEQSDERQSETEENVPKGTRSTVVIHPLQSWKNISKKPPPGFPRRRRLSVAVFETQENRFLPARVARRQSAPPRVQNVSKPRQVKSASIASRRSSRSSLTSAASFESIHIDEKETQCRSYRLLREAFKKKKIEVPNPKEGFLNAVKADHLSKTINLHERTLEKFDELFSNKVFSVY